MRIARSIWRPHSVLVNLMESFPLTVAGESGFDCARLGDSPLMTRGKRVAARGISY